MKKALYLAMTANEYRTAPSLPDSAAWMACHFSPYGTGLSNLPDELPEGSLLILNDRTPIHGHDPELICAQLNTVCDSLKCSGILLDFQRRNDPETKTLCEHLSAHLQHPFAAVPWYLTDNAAVFLPPVPPDELPVDCIRPWMGREIWMEAALSRKSIAISQDGSAECEFQPAPEDAVVHSDSALHCSYYISADPDHIQFHLFRTKKDLEELMNSSGPEIKWIGLYQELKDFAEQKKTAP